jgi:hypothetical protein
MDDNVIAKDKKKKKTKVQVWSTNQWIAMWGKTKKKSCLLISPLCST